MLVPGRYASLRRLQVLLGLAVIGFLVAPSASGAAQADTVTASGSAGIFSNININAQAGTSGQNPSGTVSFTVANAIFVSGPVTCLSVTGPDQGGGSVGSPTTAVLNFQSSEFGVATVKLVDNGGNGADVFASDPTGRPPTDCSPITTLSDSFQMTNGRAVVFDAPVLPTSKEQCKKGGFRNYPQFKNQGDCVSFVATHGKNQPG